MEIFDKEKKLWQTQNHQQPSDDEQISPGHRMLDAITAHGSKLAQVFPLTFIVLFETYCFHI